jgi:hypothetical protein
MLENPQWLESRDGSAMLPFVESPPVLANGGVKNEARGGRGPRSAQRTKSRVAVSNLLS